MNEFNLENWGYTMLDFLLMVVVLEHVLVAIKAAISYAYGDLPESIKDEQRVRNTLTEKFKKEY